MGRRPASLSLSTVELRDPRACRLSPAVLDIPIREVWCLSVIDGEEDSVMKVGRFVGILAYSMIGALVFMSVTSSRAMAQDHDHGVMSQGPQTAQQQKQASELVATVREVTERFKDVSQAGPDYALLFG